MNHHDRDQYCTYKDGSSKRRGVFSELKRLGKNQNLRNKF